MIKEAKQIDNCNVENNMDADLDSEEQKEECSPWNSYSQNLYSVPAAIQPDCFLKAGRKTEFLKAERKIANWQITLLKKTKVV